MKQQDHANHRARNQQQIAQSIGSNPANPVPPARTDILRRHGADSRTHGHRRHLQIGPDLLRRAISRRND